MTEITMTEFILFVLSTIGLTMIMVESSIMAPVRDFMKSILPEKVYKVFECHQCMGTWCGFICGATFISSDLWHVLLLGCAGSFVCVLAASILNYLEAQTLVNLDE